MSLTKEQLLHAYRKMREIRDFEVRIHEINTSGIIPGFLHLYAGEEAIAVGACMNLQDTDFIASTHRGHGHCIAKGVNIKAMMAEIYAKETGTNGGKGGSMHICDLSKGMLGANGIVGGGPPLTIGAALTAKTKKNGGVALSFTGDGGSNQGLVFEAMNMAVVLKLPMIFMFENNGFSEFSVHDYTVGGRDIRRRAEGFGMPAVKVDGLDVEAVYDAVKEAVERAKRGEGPTAIEAVTTRHYGHYEGDPMLYRDKEELADSRKNKDCLILLRAKIKESGLIDEAQLDAIDAEVAQLIDEAVAEAEAAPVPPVENVLTDVYINY